MTVSTFGTFGVFFGCDPLANFDLVCKIFVPSHFLFGHEGSPHNFVHCASPSPKSDTLEGNPHGLKGSCRALLWALQPLQNLEGL